MSAPDRSWDDEDHARSYLAERQDLPHRTEGEHVLAEALSDATAAGSPLDRVLDLGTGDGRVLEAVLDAHGHARGVALDHNPAMLSAASARFADDRFGGDGGDRRVEVVEHDLAQPLPAELGLFDAVVSGLTLHHFDDDRRAALHSEIRDHLRPGGFFADLDLVRSASEALHDRFIDRSPWTRKPHLAWDRNPTVAQRMAWMQAAGFTGVDCLWRYRELALVVGEVPAD